MTDTELKLIAAAAIIGGKSNPKAGLAIRRSLARAAFLVSVSTYRFA